MDLRHAFCDGDFLSMLIDNLYGPANEPRGPPHCFGKLLPTTPEVGNR